MYFRKHFKNKLGRCSKTNDSCVYKICLKTHLRILKVFLYFYKLLLQWNKKWPNAIHDKVYIKAEIRKYLVFYIACHVLFLVDFLNPKFISEIRKYMYF